MPVIHKSQNEGVDVGTETGNQQLQLTEDQGENLDQQYVKKKWNSNYRFNW